MTATTSKVQPLDDDEDGLWTTDFDGAVGSDGAGIGVWIRSPFSVSNQVPNKVQVCSYKLAFDCSNNEAEYEALIAGLKILRKLKAKKIAIYGDSESVIKQVKGEFQAKHPRMRAYRNAVLDILKRFSEHTLTCIPRIQNGCTIHNEAFFHKSPTIKMRRRENNIDHLDHLTPFPTSRGRAHLPLENFHFCFANM